MDDPKLKPDPPADEYPAVNAAFGFVIPSYQLLATRFEAADNRITTLLTLTLSITLGTPVFAKSMRPDADFGHPLFILGAVFALACVTTGVVGRIRGRIVLPDPAVMYEKSLRRSEHSFKMSQIWFAGENFDKNSRAINSKGNVSTIMTILAGSEVFLFVVWLTV